MNPKIYFDHNATAPVKKPVMDAMICALKLCGNASSMHSSGRNARKLIEQSRDRVAKLIKTSPEQVIFTSGGTEANNLVIDGINRDHCLISAIEHDSILQTDKLHQKISVNEGGCVELGTLEKLLRVKDTPNIVSVMLANNETGVIQPIEEIVRLSQPFDTFVHTDAIQACGKVNLDWGILGVDALSLSAHKIGGPQGVGALILNKKFDLDARFFGGGQERSFRPGTENVPGIVGFGLAAELAADLDRNKGIELLRNELERKILKIAPNAVIHGQQSQRIPNTSCISMPGVLAETQIMKFDLAGIMVSAGSACSSGKVQNSHVLRAMGVKESEASSAIRVSLGYNNTIDEIDYFVKQWKKISDVVGSGNLREVA